MGSWHWLTCDHDHGHMYTCSGKGILKACCCHTGFAYVDGNSLDPVGKGAAAGATSGALVTGALLGHDLGASTAVGAAGGAVSGAVNYAMEGGKCQRKDELDKVVRVHLS